MTDKQAYEILSKILDTISEEEYPEIYSTIFAYIDEDAEGLSTDPFVIASELHEADATKQLPKCVAEFLMEVYEEEYADGNANAACDIGSLYYTGRAGEQNYTFLESAIRRVIDRCQTAADNHDGLEQQDVSVLKLLYLVRYIEDIKANIDNISILMIDDIRTDKIALRASVTESLERLLSQNYISRNGDT